MRDHRDFQPLGKGADRAPAVLFCPVHHGAVDAGACGECAHCAALRSDEGPRRSVVLCALDEHRGEVPRAGDAGLADLEIARRTSAPIAAILIRCPVTARPGMKAAALAALLVDHDLQGAPVVDAEGRPIGAVARADLHKGEGAELTVSAVMTSTALCLPDSATIGQAAALMAFEGAFLLPVVSAAREVVGLVSSLDVLRWLARQSGYGLPG